MIAGGRNKDIVLRVNNGEPDGTLLLADQAPLAAQTVVGHLQVKGTLVLIRALAGCLGNGCCLAVGVTAVKALLPAAS